MALAIAVATAGTAASSTDPSPPSTVLATTLEDEEKATPTRTRCRGHYHRHGGRTYATLIRRAYARHKWRRSNPVTRKQRERIVHHRRCARDGKALRYMRRASARQRSAFREHRQGQLAKQRAAREAARLAAALPFPGPNGTRWAIPWSIVACESGGNFGARNPSSTAGGAYQIINGTWYAYGGSRYADSHPAAVAPASEQHAVAGRIWAGGSGRSHWVC